MYVSSCTDGYDRYNSIGLNILDGFVGIFATISTIMHIRSLVKSTHFAQMVRAFFLQKFSIRLKWRRHLLPLFNLWFTGVILGNCLATVGALMKLILSLNVSSSDPSLSLLSLSLFITRLAHCPFTHKQHKYTQYM